MVGLREAKTYMRVDADDDDALITSLLATARALCVSIVRSDGPAVVDAASFNTGVLYALAYLYEHREEADHRELELTLRSLLSPLRSVVF